ncbi:hypothetical protein ACFLQJ_00840 [Calditrichota bacterium]
MPEIQNTDGDFNEVKARLYDIFCYDFFHSPITFSDLEVWVDRRIIEDEYEEGFWHLTTKKDHETGERLFDPRRAERLHWCRVILESSEDPEVKVFDYDEFTSKGVKTRTYVWLENFNYVIVLEKRNVGTKDIYFLITAYYVSYSSSRRKLNKKMKRSKS